MVTWKKVTKADVMREILKQEPDATPTRIHQLVRARGHKISQGYVYQFRQNNAHLFRKTFGPAKPELIPSPETPTNTPSVEETAKALLQVQQLAAKLGGVRKLQTLVNILGAVAA